MRIEDFCWDLSMLPRDHRVNLEALVAALNPIEEFWIQQGNEPWRVTSGYRFMSDHVRIYKKKNEQRKKEKKKLLAIPLGSQHLRGNAVDILDTNDHLKTFISTHLELFEEKNLYFEDFKYTKGYVHIQSVPPKSGVRFFKPF